MIFVFHQIHPENFFQKKNNCRPPPLRTTVAHLPTTTHRCGPGSGFIVVHVCMCDGMIYAFHQIHPDGFCRPPPLRTTVGHPPTTKHRYAPGSGSIVVHVCMCKGMIFIRSTQIIFADGHLASLEGSCCEGQGCRNGC
jgi:hypothetical protein